jgi:uncharacterized zinc-type alcohol dehydrogenase-like protein
MAVKLARAFGARVVVFTTSPDKAEDAVRLGAHDVVVSRSAAEMRKHQGSFDFILDTVSAVHDLNTYLNLLKRDGTLTLVGAPETPVPLGVMSPLFGRRRLAGSIIGGIRETQEMLDFFFRAFQQWEGDSPGEWRARHARSARSRRGAPAGMSVGRA